MLVATAQLKHCKVSIQAVTRHYPSFAPQLAHVAGFLSPGLGPDAPNTWTITGSEVLQAHNAAHIT